MQEELYSYTKLTPHIVNIDSAISTRVFLILGVTAATQLILLPYGYLANPPFSVYHQSQDTRAGVHAYRYAGDSSAKEEARGLDGVTRGSYSYLDAHGILQSVFYVADEDGFRVAATNLPTDGNSSFETSEILLAKYAHPQEFVKAATEEKKRRLVNSALIPRLTGAVTSHQSRVDVHNNIRLKAVQPIKTIGILSEPAETVILPNQIPLVTSHQSRVQVHNDLRVEVPEKLVNVETIEVQPQIAEAAAVKLQPLSLVSDLPDYNENRIQLHRNLGLEGSNRKDAMKIDAAGHR
ncbi:Cuticle protein 6 [Cyphomyrmex costatus]|uniref:Cuticle protein 6 n=1 Tax=Cyphomyrmex costatus TaxID=456900 RepID=A0A151IL92_9HYME|nr:Cuticle protein 6 [Cyphomyrmex costatus]